MRIMITDDKNCASVEQSVSDELENFENIKDELDNIVEETEENNKLHDADDAKQVLHETFINSEIESDNAAVGVGQETPESTNEGNDSNQFANSEPDVIELDKYNKLLDRYNRMMRDWDSYRARTAADIERAKETANANIIEALLPTLDNFDRALAHAQANSSSGIESVVNGFKAIQRSMLSALEREGVIVIDPLGKPFDMNKHQAVERVKTSEYPIDTVVNVLQPGYELNGKLIRPAIVSVSVPSSE